MGWDTLPYELDNFLMAPYRDCHGSSFLCKLVTTCGHDFFYLLICCDRVIKWEGGRGSEVECGVGRGV